MRDSTLRALTLVLVPFGTALLAAANARAHPEFVTQWQSVYPSSQSDDNVLAGTGTECQLCHANSSGGNPWNAYGWAIRMEVDAGANILDAIDTVSTLDSDFDPNADLNEDEIMFDTQPGWTEGSNNTIYFRDFSVFLNQPPPPGIIGDLDDPGVQGSPQCELEMSQASYAVGDDVVITKLRYTNPSAATADTHLIFEITIPSFPVFAAIDGVFQLSAGLDNDLGPIPMFTNQGQFPSGTWELRCATLDPVTAEVYAEVVTGFDLP